MTALFFDIIMQSDFDVMEAAFNADNWEFLVAYAVVGIAFSALAMRTWLAGLNSKCWHGSQQIY